MMASSNRLKIKSETYDVYNENLDNFTLLENHALDIEYYNLRKKYIASQYLALTENNEILLHESNSNFLDAIVNLLKKFINLIKEVYNRFVSMVLNLKNKFLLFFNKKKIDVSKLTVKNIRFEGFKFTLDAVPNTKINDLTINGDFVFNKQKFDSLTPNDLIKIDQSAETENFDYIRGRVLNKHYSISEREFPYELKRVFRNGEESPSQIMLDDYETLEDMITDLTDILTTVVELKRYKEKTIKEYSKVIDYFSKLATIRFDRKNGKTKEVIKIKQVLYTDGYELSDKDITIDYDGEKLDLVRKYAIARSKEAKQISEIVCQVFTAKLTAIKDKYFQDFSILKTVINVNYSLF